MEILPIKLLTDEDSSLFGKLALNLAKLQRTGFPVASGIAVTPPQLKLKTILERGDFGSKEIFEQSLTLVKKEIFSIPVPEILTKEAARQKDYLLDRAVVRSVKSLWLSLLQSWVDQITDRLWKEGFYKGITDQLDPKIIIFVKKVESIGSAYFDPIQDDTVINVAWGKLEPHNLKKLDELVREADKKLFIPHQYEWIVDGGVKLVGIKPYTPGNVTGGTTQSEAWRKTPGSKEQGSWIRNKRPSAKQDDKSKSVVKIFLDLSAGLVVEKEVDGVYIASEKIFDLNKPSDSFENLVFRIVESALTFPSSPTFVKLPDKSEGMGKVRGTLRLLHQRSLFEPITDALDFVRHKKGLSNVHIVIPFVRGVNELLQIKRELAVKKLSRKNSLQLWMEVCTPENVINLEEYLLAGVDGVVLNLDELIAHFNGFDKTEQELMFYKNEVGGLLKFIEESLKLLHKSKIQFIAFGSLSLYPQVLEFLVEKGIYGIVVERYEAHSAHGLLHEVERRVILKKSS